MTPTALRDVAIKQKAPDDAEAFNLIWQRLLKSD
jgi:hypothetical protein